MFLCIRKKESFLLLFIILLCTYTQNLLGQEKPTTFFGAYYRANQFLPILVHQKDDFNAIWVENKYSKDALIFNQEKYAEALVKVSSDAGRFELINKKEERKLLSLSLRIVPEELPLIVIASKFNNMPELEKEKFKLVETTLLPNFAASYEMIDVLLLQETYEETLTAQQSEAIRHWVLAGGILIFDSMQTLAKHSGLGASLLKQTNLKYFEALKNEDLPSEMSKWASQIANAKCVTSAGYGFIGIKSFPEGVTGNTLNDFCDGRIQWHIRNRNNSIAEKNSLHQEISSSKIILIQKLTLIYFLLFMIFMFLKLKNHYTTIACCLATLAIIPAVLLTPSRQLDSHYYQLVNKKSNTDLSLLREEAYIHQGNVAEIKLKIENNMPFFASDDVKIILTKNVHGQYTDQILQPRKEYFSLRKTSLTKNNFFKKSSLDNNINFFHKFPLQNIYKASEQNVQSFQFHVDAPKSKILNTKLLAALTPQSRDHFDKKPWYAATNQFFYSTSEQPKSIFILEGNTLAIPLEFTEPLNIQQSFFAYLSIEN